MRTETIDGVLHYVWRQGDELPSYQPVGVEWMTSSGSWLFNGTNTADWKTRPRRWPKLLNDRAQHQRLLDEAYEHAVKNCRPVQAFDVTSSMMEGIRLIQSNEGKKTGLVYLARAGAHILRLMEWAQGEIDKEHNPDKCFDSSCTMCDPTTGQCFHEEGADVLTCQQTDNDVQQESKVTK